MTQKEHIESLLNNGDLQQARKLLDEYETKYPKDMDNICMNCLYYIYSKDYDTALQYALEGISKYPTCGDMYYNLAYIYEMLGDALKAGKYYFKAFYIFSLSDSEKCSELNLDNKMAEQIELVAQYSEQYINSTNPAHLEILRDIQTFNYGLDAFFGLHDPYFCTPSPIIGEYHYTCDDRKRYVARHKDFLTYDNPDFFNLLYKKANMLEVTEGNTSKTKENGYYLLPIACSLPDTIHEITVSTGKHFVIQHYDKHFDYYRLSGNAVIQSSNKSYYGKPIMLKQDPEKYKLVLNIFVDGLAYALMHDDNFSKCMPYTYKFFSNGTICQHAYNTAEWTYPSVANIVSGLDTTEHMLFHPDINCAIPDTQPILSEYYKEAGYYTAALSGNWRIIPTYGHDRGYDQFVYQNQWIGCKVEMVAGDTIDQIEAFKETNQFLTITYGDLHDIADGVGLPISVQKELSLDMREIEDVGATSAKQEYSPQKINAYLHQLKRVDLHLHTLFTYIEENFSDDEILVSLFSDHGQGYMIPNGRHFLSKERCNVAFMFRGRNVPCGICNEIISTTDYVQIMCKLAGIPLKKGCEKGNLPVWFGGNNNREYALSESIHPNDPYYAAIFTKDFICFFENPSPVGNDGRFLLSNERKIWLESYDGIMIENQHTLEYYENIILEHIAPLIIY